MGKYVIGGAVALAVAAGAYYFLFMDVQRVENERAGEFPRGASVDVQVNRIPEGVIMEDGTLPE